MYLRHFSGRGDFIVATKLAFIFFPPVVVGFGNSSCSRAQTKEFMASCQVVVIGNMTDRGCLAQTQILLR
jgi:hypothetical protein